MKRQALLLFLCFLPTVLLARMDHDVTSFAEIVRWENVPALVLYTLLFRGILLSASVTSRLVARRAQGSVSR